MNKFTQSIIVFGIALPILGLVILLGIEIGVSGYFADQAAQRKDAWDAHTQRLQQIAKADKDIKVAKPEDTRNVSALDGDVKLKLTQSLAGISQHYGINDLQVTDSTITDGIGEWNTYKKAQVKTGQFKIDSRYETLQDALTRLEVEQPELLLDSVSIETIQNKDTEPALEATITYQAWSSPSDAPSNTSDIPSVK